MVTLSVTPYGVPAPPKGGAFCIYRSAVIKLPLRGSWRTNVSLRGFSRPLEGRLPPAGGRCRVATKGGVWLRPAGADGRGTSRAIRFALEPEILPPCQGLSLWESWQARQGLTERARTLAENEPFLREFPYHAARPSGIRRAALLRLLERIDREMAMVISPDPAFSAGSMRG